MMNRVGYISGEMGRGIMQHGTAAIVRCNGKIIGLRHGCDLLGFGNPPAPEMSGMMTWAARFSNNSRNPHAGHQPFTHAQGQIGRARQVRISCEVVLRQHFLQPHRLVCS